MGQIDPIDALSLIGSTMGLGFIAGIRLYATVLALGLAIRFQWIHLAGNMQQLNILGHPAVLTAAAIATLAEFFMDKVPWVDSVWNTFHTIIRPVGAAILAAAVLGPVDPALKVVLIILCGSVAFASHSSKLTSRLVVNHSPEPFSNIGLSLVEDALAPVAIWMSYHHPLIVMVLVSIFLCAFIWLAPKIYRAIRRPFIAVKHWLAGTRAEMPLATGLEANLVNPAPHPKTIESIES